jgi:hypothetical protein
MSRTTRLSLGVAAAGAAALGLVGAGAGAALSSPQLRASHASTPTLKITISKKLTLSGPRSFQAGRVALKLTAVGNGRSVEVVSFKKGYSFKALRADLGAFGASIGKTGTPSKAGLKHLNNAVNHTNLYGGLNANAGTSLRGTVVLPTAGKYVLYNDSGNLPAQAKTLTVTGPMANRAKPDSSATVVATSAKRFGGASVLPAKGTITFRNKSTNSPHFLVLQRVKLGTTRQQVIAALMSSSPPTIFLKQSASTDIVGEGNAQTLTYHMPKGDYVEMCFFPDLQTGIPHALMGMDRIVHLK